MRLVILTAIGVGGATLIGSILGFLFGRAPKKITNTVFYISYIVMLVAAVCGLIIPAYECGINPALVSIGIILGIIILFLTDKILSFAEKRENCKFGKSKKIYRTWLLIVAIGIHNFPEGIAAGVGFGSGDNRLALFIAGGIALQNIPEGMIVIPPMLVSGMNHKKAALFALMTGGVEVLGTMVGYFAVNISSAILPYILAFAGGTMLYVIANEVLEHVREKNS